MENNPIGTRIETLIKHLGISQTAFAKSLNTSGTRISNITQGRNKPDSQLLSAIAEIYPQVNATWLLTGRGKLDETVKISGQEKPDVLPVRASKNPPPNPSETHPQPTIQTDNAAAKPELDTQRSQELKALWSTLVHKEGLDLVGIHYAGFTSILGIYSDRVLAYVAEKVEGQLNSILGEHLDKTIDTQGARTKLRQAVAPLNALQDKILAVDHAIYDMMEHVFKAYPDAMELVKGTVIPVNLMPVTDEMLKDWAEESEKNREKNASLAA